MPVFVSYYRSDEDRALRIRNYLDGRNVTTYIDLLDPGLQGLENVTQKILAGLHRCTHLLAVVSPETVKSWWVPFEIGVATEGERRISSYATMMTVLPEYLKVWPVLTREAHLDDFVRRYKEDHLLLKSRSLGEHLGKPGAQVFHRNLKRDLGQ